MEYEKFLKATLDEIDNLLNTKSVVGEPIVFGDTTIIPLVSIGFGFGSGVGSGIGKTKDLGGGAASGAGGGVKPIAIIIITKEGVRVEPIKGGISTMMQTAGEVIAKALEKKTEPKKKS